MANRSLPAIHRLAPQTSLFSDEADRYHPRPAALFRPTQIVLAKGSTKTAARRSLAEQICAAYGDAQVVEDLATPHNRVRLGPSDALELHDRGKQTLVLGEHNSAVRHSREEGNACPNYWHFSPYGFCPYGCDYCYLAGTQGVRFSPTVKIFLNLPETLQAVDRIARRIGEPTAFYVGKLQDGLALDALTGYSRRLVPFFARHRWARMVLLTKSAEVENLPDLDHGGHSILSWTVNPPEVGEAFESNTPPVAQRIEAMCRCARAGYPIRAVVMPIVPLPDWRDVYRRFLQEMMGRVGLQRITLGSICSYPAALRLTQHKLGKANLISRSLDGSSLKCDDGRARFPRTMRAEIYRFLIDVIRRARPGLQTGLCLEEPAMFDLLDVPESLGRCNCVL